jgi:hypothetical protein
VPAALIPAGGECLEDQGSVCRVSPEPPTSIDAAHAEFRHPAHFCDGEVLSFVAGDRVRRRHLGGEKARHIADGDLLFIERELRETPMEVSSMDVSLIAIVLEAWWPFPRTRSDLLYSPVCQKSSRFTQEDPQWADM